MHAKTLSNERAELNYWVFVPFKQVGLLAGEQVK
jgi:hypothetical protein